MTTPQIADDLLIDQCEFHLTPEILAAKANIRSQIATLLREKGADQLVDDARRIYDFIQGLERQGLRGRELFLAFRDNHELFALHNECFYLFYVMGAWGSKIGKVLTLDGELFPFDDLLVGELVFGIDIQSILDAGREYPNEGGPILEEDGAEVILAAAQNIYDTARRLESEGLRGYALFVKMNSDPQLLAASHRYYCFIRGRIWGYRIQSIWW